MSKVLPFLFALGEKWQAWLAIFMVCVGLEAGAIYFQEVLMYYPCELCIYTRVWMTAMALFALVAIPLRHNVWARRACIVIQLVLTFGLIRVVWKLLGIEYGWGPDGACSLYANFPQWAPLDEWLPVLFKVQDSCAATPKVLFSLSMADGLAVVSSGVFLALAFALWGSFRPVKM
ncbi:disulfide bond formation protein B [Teredinibacter purpureus]|uniref:disulfide bond formation protein B n=1 Tax=Teredinibacter purpureus TaxID=2731756 RepID=UPI0005F7CBF4|nr:disulfide bond formation protein B [Teredinibacter purpureus]